MTNLKHHPMLIEAGWCQIRAALSGQVRIVGGAVRDAILKRDIQDVDLATPLHPDEVQERLSRNDITVIPTGLQHGTVTAVVDGKGYEITTLRQDIETDGRHAEVIYTDDWEVDAARRDFTINAMSLDGDGVVYDYYGGQDDLANGVVRFVGDADLRVREDYLRILRLFRFFAFYGKPPVDANALAAVKRHKDKLTKLSAERIQQELLKLLSAKDPVAAIEAIIETRVLSVLIPPARDAVLHLKKLVAYEKTYGEAPHAIRRLAAVVSPSPSVLTMVLERLKLSNKDTKFLTQLVRLKPDQSERGVKVLVYQYGQALAVESLILHSAPYERVQFARSWQVPELPVTGHDLEARGLQPGPQMGELLAALEQAWIKSDFRLSKDELLASL